MELFIAAISLLASGISLIIAALALAEAKDSARNMPRIVKGE